MSTRPFCEHTQLGHVTWTYDRSISRMRDSRLSDSAPRSAPAIVLLGGTVRLRMSTGPPKQLRQIEVEGLPTRASRVNERVLPKYWLILGLSVETLIPM